MSQDKGDRAYWHGESVTRKNSTGSTLDAGKWVAPTGDETVAYADANAGRGDLVGVVQDSIDDGYDDTVHLHGAILARVDSGVTAGDELAAPDSSLADEDAGVAESGGSSGIYAVGDAVDDGDGNYYAPVLLR